MAMSLPTLGTPPSHVYDASNSASITESGGAVSQWDDDAGSADVTQGTGSAQPTTDSITTPGSENAFDFDGGDSLANDIPDIAQPLTIVVVGKWDLPSDGNQYRFQDGGVFLRKFTDNNNQLRAGSNVVGSAADSDWHVYIYVVDGSSSEIFIDGVSDATGNAGSNSLTELNIGGSNSQLDGGIAAFMVYPVALSSGDISTLSSYLSDYWISGSPPVSDFPFRRYYMGCAA